MYGPIVKNKVIRDFKILERGRLEERLGRRGTGSSVRGGKRSCVRKRQREVSSAPVMASFKETREALLLSHASGFITDVEFLLLYEENMSDNLDFPYDEYPSFNLQDKDEAECKANFRVEKHHVSRLVDALDIPAVFICQQGTVCEKE